MADTGHMVTKEDHDVAVSRVAIVHFILDVSIPVLHSNNSVLLTLDVSIPLLSNHSSPLTPDIHYPFLMTTIAWPKAKQNSVVAVL